MSDKLLKLFDAFYQAKRVNHYYWMHTDGDEAGGKVSIENLQWIIQTLTGFVIEKKTVKVKSDFHRAFVERHEEGKVNKIWVMEGEHITWQRFATVKEMCHLLVDQTGDHQPDPCQTIDSLKNGSGLFDDFSVPEADSERLAEIIATELIYPLEYRKPDRDKVREGASTIDQIAELRGVPSKYISLGISDTWIAVCETIWKSLKDVDPANLNEHL
ncbi:MAG: hypothetical protein U1A24_08385 [Cypionkella sp.]|uniref:hypothetical protein n=1 Tax=Cypionkella sp. TaxID=2811411 RepID=UPI002AB9F651|nr:hypothetical protein [Cypionkella sp.]MDZ4310561.1 hypothetical protein [Cypionkella sp.]